MMDSEKEFIKLAVKQSRNANDEQLTTILMKTYQLGFSSGQVAGMKCAIEIQKVKAI